MGMYRVQIVTPEGFEYSMDYCLEVHALRAKQRQEMLYPNDLVSIRQV